MPEYCLSDSVGESPTWWRWAAIEVFWHPNLFRAIFWAELDWNNYQSLCKEATAVHIFPFKVELPYFNTVTKLKDFDFILYRNMSVHSRWRIEVTEVTMLITRNARIWGGVWSPSTDRVVVAVLRRLIFPNRPTGLSEILTCTGPMLKTTCWRSFIHQWFSVTWFPFFLKATSLVLVNTYLL